MTDKNLKHTSVAYITASTFKSQVSVLCTHAANTRVGENVSTINTHTSYVLLVMQHSFAEA